MRILKYIIILIASTLQMWGQEYEDTKNQRRFDYFYYEGLKLKNSDRFDAAFDMFAHCYDIDSTSAPLLFELSSFYLMQDNSAKAVELLKSAVRYSSKNFTYKMALATTIREMGIFSEAIEVYKELVTEFPEKTELLYYLADAFTQSKQTADAIKTYNQLESVTGMSEGIAIQKYRLYTMLEKTDSAMAEIEKLANKYPLEARYPIMIGDLYLEEGKTDKAYGFYQKAHSIDSTNPYYIVSMSNYYEAINDNEAAETQIRNALINEKLDVETKVGIISRYILKLERSQKDNDRAIELFEMLIEQHPDVAELRMMYGRILIMKEKTEDAKFQFRLVSETEPENQAAWQALLELALKNQDTTEIIAVCRKCVELFPNEPEYYFYLSVGYYQQDSFDSAIEACRQGAEKIPEENKPLKSTFYGQIGDIFHQSGKVDEAFEAYEKALSYNERNILVLNNYAYFLSLLDRDLQKAERMSAQCIKAEPDNPTYLDTYAWIFFRQGNYKLAKIYIESAIDKDKADSVELFEHYGDILFMTGDKENAVVQWKKAKEMGKENSTLESKISEEKYIEYEK